MKKSILSFFLFGAILSAAPVSVTFVSGNNAGPYTLNVNGQTVQAMCMDNFLSVGGSWTADLTAVNSNNFSNTYLGNQSSRILGQSYTSKQVYTAEAYLFNEILQPHADRTDIQEAAWDIMNPTTLWSDSFTDRKAVNFLEDAFSNDQNFNTAGYEIVSDIRNCNQEFMINPTPASATPEPATFALMGAGLFAAGATRLFRRKKEAEVKG